MERLTKRNEVGYGVVGDVTIENGIRRTILTPHEASKIQEALNRLAAYEETGLEPERVAELAKAEKDGRLVVLPCKRDTVLRGPTRSPAQNDMIRDAERELRRIPAADVAPVRHGRWLLARPGEWTAVMECSECGRRIYIDPRAGDIEKDYPYCHCRAKMDGEVKL